MSSEVEKKNEGTDVYSILRDDIICLRLRPGLSTVLRISVKFTVWDVRRGAMP